MLGNTYTDQDCSIARTLEVVGERWTLLVVREAVGGTRRFEDFQANLGIARNVLTSRLARLVDEGVLERVAYQDRPVRYEYRPTSKGVDLMPVLAALMAWGDRYAPCDDSPLAVLTHADCGHEVEPSFECAHCHEPVRADAMEIVAGRTFRAANA